MVGVGCTVIGDDAEDVHPVKLVVNIKVTDPSEIAVIMPLFAILAIAGLELVQVPPVVGVILAVSPIHSELVEGAVIFGALFTVTVTLFSDTHP